MLERTSYYAAKIAPTASAERSQNSANRGRPSLSLGAALSLATSRRDHNELKARTQKLEVDLERAQHQVSYLSCVPAGESTQASLWRNDIVQQIHDYKVTSFTIKSKFAGLKTLDALPGSIVEYDRMLTAFKEGIPYVPLSEEMKIKLGEAEAPEGRVFGGFLSG